MVVFAFVVATLLWAALNIYLSWRQVIHVVGHRHAVPVDFASSVSLQEHQKAADYTVAREKLSRLETLICTAVSLGWVLGGTGLLYSTIATLMPPSLSRGVAFLIAAFAVQAVIRLPLQAHRVFGLEQRFGFNRTSVRTFLLDRTKGACIGMVVAVPLLYLTLWCMTAFKQSWWVWTWLGLVALMLAAPIVYVRLIAPRFNRFEPLRDETLRARIQALLTRAGFRSAGLFRMDASRRSAHGNAFFIGFGRTKRIVLFDTLLASAREDEVTAVVAHELGHFRYHHVLLGLAQGAVTTFVGLGMFGYLAAQPWLLPDFGLYENDPALVLFVCMLLASVMEPIFAPLSHWISRRHEFQADDYARREVGADPMIRALTGLARENASTLTPDAIYALVYYSHPPVPVRVQQLRRAGASGHP